MIAAHHPATMKVIGRERRLFGRGGEDHRLARIVEDGIVRDRDATSTGVDGDASTAVAVDRVAGDAHHGVVPRGDAISRRAMNLVVLEYDMPAICYDVGATRGASDRVALREQPTSVNLDAGAHAVGDCATAKLDACCGAYPHA